MSIDTSKRTSEVEIMDDFDLQGNELDQTLRDLDNINKWLGGNKITLEGVKNIVLKQTNTQEIHITDVGCGNGAVLREIARWGRKNKYNLKLAGIDANTHAIGIAEKMSIGFPEIEFLALDIFSEEFKNFHCDIILCTLTLHHFKNGEILELLNLFSQQSRLGVVINDLHRSKLAYRLFQVFCSVFIRNEIARKDGLISILRGFKKEELKNFAGKIPQANHKITWKWAFRYRWIIQKEKI
ncbi:methyltransferase domain-containing protein [Salegentibacter sp. JZCK2]|uniref:methyltransferase domain-containing protein n=1 Tax=Salegentibacter tibetensis TaxID=2873600 RepID=UPI001CCC25E2|nr:methyltransferase domain-containing protein [Salegentibacter tibetensis]MBZ9729698.1 methyltransferase domain-containing protein [Salegentibacter tibetensis]